MDAVKRKALRGSSKFAKELHDLHTQVEEMAGANGVLLYEVQSFTKTLKHPRVVPKQALAAIAQAIRGADVQGAIKFRQNLFKAMVSASVRYSTKTWLPESD